MSPCRLANLRPIKLSRGMIRRRLVPLLAKTDAIWAEATRAAKTGAKNIVGRGGCMMTPGRKSGLQGPVIKRAIPRTGGLMKVIPTTRTHDCLSIPKTSFSVTSLPTPTSASANGPRPPTAMHSTQLTGPYYYLDFSTSDSY